MPDSIQLISVFIGSPSGLEAERKTARAIVEELNRDHSRHWGCILDLVGWEETLPGHGRPQELINKDLDRCEYFIGVLYDHWGSPTAEGDSRYSSGFEEEFERAKAHLKTGSMKDMAVFFKEVPAERRRDPGPSLTKVIDFRKACFARKDALYTDFSDISGFESLVRAKLNAIGWAEFEKRRSNREPTEQAEQPKRVDHTSKTNSDKTKPLISPPTESFLNTLMQRSSEAEETSATDVARLRLIGSSLHRSGNDDTVIGNHDANILFVERDEIEFSRDETRALLHCGIEGFGHQNVPLWHWLSNQTKFDKEYGLLRLTAAIGKDSQQRHAIRLLTLLQQEPLELQEPLNREGTIRDWMKEDAKPGVFKSAIEYLHQHGKSVDVPLLEVFYSKTTSQKKAEIGQVIISIEARSGESYALNRALELGIDEVNETLGDQLFSKPSSLTTNLLTRCLRSEANSIRRRAISILNDRKETDPTIADSLLSDTDYGVRYFATEALHIANRPLDSSVVKTALTIVKKPGALGLFSGMQTDSQFFDRYRMNRLSELSFNELKEKVDKGNLLEEDEAVALFQKHTRRAVGELREHLQDGFYNFFERRLEKLKSEIGHETKTFLDAEKLIPFLKRRMLTAGTEALTTLEDKGDLELVRYVFDNFEVDVSNALLSFLGRFGDWSDLRRIDGLGEFTSSRVNSLLFPTPPALPQKASAMISIARNRIADLLETDFSVLLRREVLKQLDRKELTSLSDEMILIALSHDDDESRAILALKCCEHLSKKRLKDLLARYTGHDKHRYYNTIHWLDMGVSMSRDTAQSVARQELAARS
ncbi:DUF4062 domain-containing protein [Seohaeicola saemankumensis]|uniref:DUF4062 domain-containing protein n=1 Tax=Seohaeicola saemankumensis TaxID=481181 RepID=UPI001E2E1BEA|nr:DUF4062 domain-containing protein [Seohaeicola saemankumensis]MCD1627867.1 DUF4062 domain-containing protein [Seohaeicola saemankumensis]